MMHVGGSETDKSEESTSINHLSGFLIKKILNFMNEQERKATSSSLSINYDRLPLFISFRFFHIDLNALSIIKQFLFAPLL